MSAATDALPQWVNDGPPARSATNLNLVNNAIRDVEGQAQAAGSGPVAYSRLSVGQAAQTVAAGDDVRFAAGTVLKRGRKIAPATATTATTRAAARKLIQLDVPVVAGRSYRFAARCPVHSTLAGIAVAQLTYTTDAALTPAGDSTRLVYTTIATPSGEATVEASAEELFEAAASGTVKMLLSLYGAVAGSYTPFATADWPIRFAGFDAGPTPGLTGVTIF